MKRLDNNQIMDFLDGTLSPQQRAVIEQHLAQHDDDRALVDEMRLAMTALHDLEEQEPVRASENFWPKLRDKLPERAPRRLWTTQLAKLIFPQNSRGMLPVRAAAIVAVIALGAMWFAPEQSTPTASAGLPADAQAFIQSASARHDAYVASQPLAAPLGDAASRETGDDDDEAGGSQP